MDDWAVGIYVALLMLEPFADLVLVLPKDLFGATIVDLELRGNFFYFFSMEVDLVVQFNP